MTVIKDFYRAEDKLVPTQTESIIQIFFNQQVSFYNLFSKPGYLNQTVIGYDGANTGVLGIAVSKGPGWLGGDSNALVELSNGNFLMGFGDSFYGTLDNIGLNSSSTDPDVIGTHNSVSYLVSDDTRTKILVNKFYWGANQNNLRYVEQNEKLTTDRKQYEANPLLTSLCTSIVIGQLYNIDWAPQGKSSLMTPDLSNQINFQLLQKKATNGYLWPLAGMISTSDGYDTVYWFTLSLFEIDRTQFAQTQIYKIPKVANSGSNDLLVSPYDWDAYSTITSLPNFMNQPELVPDSDIYTCTITWTRSFFIDNFQYLMGAAYSSARNVYLTRTTKACTFVKGFGIQAWTKKGWTTYKCPNQDISFEAIVFQMNDGSDPFVGGDQSNQLSEIYKKDDTYNILYLASFSNLGSLTIKHKVYRFRASVITGPYVRDELPIFEDFNPIFDTFIMYEPRAYPQLNTFVPSERDGKQLQVVFSVVGQPLYTYGNSWYDLPSLFQTYKPQFYFYYA